VAMAVSMLVFFVFSGQRLRGLLALAPVAAALFLAVPGLNEVYLAFAAPVPVCMVSHGDSLTGAGSLRPTLYA
jgi:hypothetical protein